ncbi:CsbD family protein [Roseomonas sp. GCM10028921]
MAIDKDRVEGAMKQAGGAVKENVGAALGDKKMEAEGAAKRTEGKVQNAAGGVKDTVRDAANKA